MKKVVLLLAAVCCFGIVQAKNYGLRFGEKEVTSKNAKDIFGDGKASYDAATNTLTLSEGFAYSLPKGLVDWNTGKELHIRLEGDAVIKAAIKSADNIVIEGAHKLNIVSNISGSALECPSLEINEGVTLDLLSRNSQEGMYALKCYNLTVRNAILQAEVTTADWAIDVQELMVDGCWMEKPKGGFVDKEKNCICFGDGTPAKRVRIAPKK